MANTVWTLLLTLLFALSGCHGWMNPNRTKTYMVGSILVEGITKNPVKHTCGKIEPFLIEREEGHMGEEPEYEGFIPDLLHELAEHLGVNFKIKLTPDKRFGDKQEGGLWDGMVGTLIRREVDIGAGPLTITSRRGRVIDFSKPFMSTGTVMVISGGLPQEAARSSTSRVSLVLRPFTAVAWLMLLGAALLIALFTVIVNRLIPLEEKDGHMTTLSRLLTTCSGGSRYSVCVLRTTLVLFVVLTVVMYTAGVVSLLLYTARVENSQRPLEQEKRNSKLLDIVDIVQSQEYKIAVMRDGASQSFLRHSNVPLYSRIFETLSYVDNITEGFDLVLKDPTYAFLTDSALVDYFLSRRPYCQLTVAGSPLNSNGYGLAYPINSPLHDLINLSILELRENGVLQMLHRKWWHDRAQCRQPTPPNKKKMEEVTPGIDGTTLGGVLVVLVVGLLLAAIVGIIERALHFRSSKVNVGSRNLRDMDGQPLHLGGATNRDLVLT